MGTKDALTVLTDLILLRELRFLNLLKHLNGLLVYCRQFKTPRHIIEMIVTLKNQRSDSIFLNQPVVQLDFLFKPIYFTLPFFVTSNYSESI